MKIEDRIRKAAASKIKVRITTRKRSANGFTVAIGGAADTVPTKAQALQTLLARVRCLTTVNISITPN